MKIFKSYMVFTSMLYRLVMFIGLPFLIFCICIIGNIREGEEFLFVIPLICIFEIMSDHFVFGGLYAKNGNKMDYLKCSNKGMTVIKNALWMDQIRRFVEIMLLVICFYILQYRIIQSNVTEGFEANLFTYIVMAFMIYSLSALGVYISRFGGMIWMNLIVTNIIYIAELILYWICLGKIGVAFVVWFLFSIAITFLSVKTAEKKVRDSYYDERN